MIKNSIRSILLIGMIAAISGCGSSGKARAPKVAKAPPSSTARAQIPMAIPPLPTEPALRTVDDILYGYGPYADKQLEPYFRKAGVRYPPREITLVGLKAERQLELWARDTGKFRLIRRYDIRAASGEAGPKLRQGDRQVPEGHYRIIGLNPNSNYHLSMRLNYPNEFDRIQAEREGRTDPGGDIFIHGNEVSAGCLAMGDAAIEELFVLVARVGQENTQVLIAPRDARVLPLNGDDPTLPVWTAELYDTINRELAIFTPQIEVSSAKPAAGAAQSGGNGMPKNQ